MKNKSRVLLLNYGNILVLSIALIVLIVVMSQLSPYFLKAGYLWTQSSFVAETSLIGLGMTLVILTGGIDLSVGSMLALSAVILGMSVNAGIHPAIAICLSILVGAAGGFLNGIIVSKLHVAPLIVTLGTMGFFRGIAMGISGGNAQQLPKSMYFIGQGKIGPVPIQLIVALVLYLIAIFILKRTKMGANLKAIGFNEQGAKFAGINVDWEKIRVYMISGMLAALMGIIYACRVSSAKADYGVGYEMNAITIAVFGGAVLSGGKASVLGSFVATVIIVLLRQGLTLVGVQSEIQSVLVGLILIFAVAFNTFVSNANKKQ